VKISVVIPHWDWNDKMGDYLDRCTRSLVADEVIIVVNDGIGMGKAINIGLRASHGDYIVVSNNDLELVQGSLEDMCNPDGVTWANGAYKGSFYCMPRWVYEKCGGYDEQFEIGYFEDDDLIHRWELADIPMIKVERVVTKHEAGTTLDKQPNRNDFFEANRRRYMAKWGYSPQH